MIKKRNEFDIIDLSDKPKDTFMKVIIVLIIILVVLSALTYLFGYEFLKPYIKV